MKKNEAINAVRMHLGADAEGHEFRASLEKGLPDLWYVTYHVEGHDIVGGDAYVVVDPEAQVFEVPASMPPHENLQAVRTGLLQRG